MTFFRRFLPRRRRGIEGAMTEAPSYRLISGDSHVNEPGDLWTARVPARMRDRAPRIERFDEGDAWVIEGVRDPINFGMNACAGLPPEEMRGWSRFEDMRHGGYDPAARTEEMDVDGVDAEVLYPTPRLAQAVAANKDVELHLALVRAYNDWLSEYVAHAPARFGGLALLPNRGAAHAVDELTRVWGRPGMRGVMLACYPNGTLEPTADDDAVWERLAAMRIPVSIHVSLSQNMPAAHRAPLPGYGRFFDAPNRIVQMIFAGIFDRYPDLAVVIAEVDCGWVPYFKEQIDNNYRRLAPVSDFTIKELPSAYVERHAHFTYITDDVGIAQRHEIGVERILWSSDYPHISSDWPHSWKTIDATFEGIDAAERDAILAGNAARLYGF
jgi:predicted TIM-barrel fold metal-dependent hydrolase